MKLPQIGLMAALVAGAAGSAHAAKGPWSATASHLGQSSSTPIVATVTGNGSGDGTYTGSGPSAERLSRGTVSASSTTGRAMTSLEGYSIKLINPITSEPAENSGFFLDTLTDFDSKTGLMSGSYEAIFLESTGVPDSTVVGGGLAIMLLIDYANHDDVTFNDVINFGTSDCPYVGNECRTSRTFSLLEVPTSITVSMGLSSRYGGGVNRAPHDYQAELNLAFSEFLPCGGAGATFCATPVAYQSAFAAVPEPATWALMIMGFGCAGAALRRRALAA